MSTSNPNENPTLAERWDEDEDPFEIIEEQEDKQNESAKKDYQKGPPV